MMQGDFPLSAYLARIGVARPVAADVEGLLRIHAAHRRAIPFENLDIPLGRGISLDRQAVFAKLVTARRGGYCFEQNQLFGDALAQMGFALRPLLARVWLLAIDTPPLTHTLNLVTIEGTQWIADAGFGGSFVPPMALEDGAEAQTDDGARHRLKRRGEIWMLERAGAPHATDGRSVDTNDWQPQYSFTLGQVEPIDLELSSHWTATRPDTRFTTLRIASIVLPDGFVALTDRDLTIARTHQVERHHIDDPISYGKTLAGHFGIALGEADIDGLGLF